MLTKLRINCIKLLNIFLVLTTIFYLVVPFGYVVNASSIVKKNPNSYWSTDNAPIFYGATKITLEIGSVDSFDVKDTRFRVFAKDFEDGDLSHRITHSGSVDVNRAGTYNITYRVSDSHNNLATLVVPVIVKDVQSNADSEEVSVSENKVLDENIETDVDTNDNEDVLPKEESNEFSAVEDNSSSESNEGEETNNDSVDSDTNQDSNSEVADESSDDKGANSYDTDVENSTNNNDEVSDKEEVALNGMSNTSSDARVVFLTNGEEGTVLEEESTLEDSIVEDIPIVVDEAPVQERTVIEEKPTARDEVVVEDTPVKGNKIIVERTLYTIPSVWNMDLAGFSRCNYGDRQILGVFLRAGESIRARTISSDYNIGIAFFNNDSAKESGYTLKSDGSWLTISNTRDGSNYDGVPVFTSPVLSRNNTSLTKTLKVELEYTSDISELQYYHYKDDEASFRSNWVSSNNSYGVIENEVLTIVVPVADINKLTNYYRNGFTSLDQFLEYYLKVVNRMDELVGLDLNPELLTDQNVRTKYLVRANAHGGGAAYYSGNHVGINSPSVASFFEMNWGGLHEIAHGYQGSFGKGSMQLGEVANNILGHYIQIDKSIYFHNGDWMGGPLPKIEDGKNSGRLSGKTFTQTDVSTRLYGVVNLFDTFEGGETYAKMFSWYRKKLNEGVNITNQEAYVLSIADIYNVNIIPYMDAWGLDLSDNVKESVYNKNYPIVGILKDTVPSSYDTVMNGEGIDTKYGLVDNTKLNKYNITSNLNLTISIGNIEDIKEKYLLIKEGNKIVRKVKITSDKITVSDLPVGFYYLQMPINSNYIQENIHVQVKEGSNNEYTYTYTDMENVDYNNYVYMQMVGYVYGTIGCQFTFSNNYRKVKINYPSGSKMSGNEYVKIYDKEGNLVLEENTSGGYFNYNKGTHSVDIEPGYVIEVNYPNKWGSKVKFYSTLTNNQIGDYTPDSAKTRYIVTDNGLMKEDMEASLVEEISYKQLKEYLVGIIENYKGNVTTEELNNRNLNFKKKSNVISAYNQLREVDKTPYTSFIDKIKEGGLPLINVIGEKEYFVNEKVDLYSLISVSDNEDGVIDIDKASTKIKTDLNTKKAGVYNVLYEVTDSDSNTSSINLEIIIKEHDKTGEDDKTDKDDDENQSDQKVDDIKKEENKAISKNNNKINSRLDSNSKESNENYKVSKHRSVENSLNDDEGAAKPKGKEDKEKISISKIVLIIFPIVILLALGYMFAKNKKEK